MSSDAIDSQSCQAAVAAVPSMRSCAQLMTKEMNS